MKDVFLPHSLFILRFFSCCYDVFALRLKDLPTVPTGLPRSVGDTIIYAYI